MGAAQSSNVANAIAEVSNSIQSNAKGTATSSDTCFYSTKLDNCTVKGDVTVTDLCNVQAVSNQIITEIQTSNLNNTIAQTLMQTAQSTVGSMGIGYASASNAATATSKVTNDISSSASSVCVQNQTSFSDFQCKNSEIDGNLIVGVNNSANFLSSQVVKDLSTATIVNSITQDITQKATATVQGIGGFLIALAMLIIAIGYVLTKPMAVLMGSRILMVSIICVVFIIIGVAMFLAKAPPFFNDTEQCLPDNSTGCSDECIEKVDGSVKLKQPPLRYAWDIIGAGDTSMVNAPTSDELGYSTEKFKAGLLQALISRAGGWNDSGYNMLTAEGFDPNSTDARFKGIPHPLKKTSNNAYYTNIDKNDTDNWLEFSSKYPLRARFILCEFLKIPTNIYMFDDGDAGSSEQNEPTNPSDKAKCYKYVPEDGGAKTLPSDTITSLAETAGFLKGQVGKCNSNGYKLQKAMRKWGWIAMIVLFVIIIIVILFARHDKKGGGSTEKPAEKSMW
jgi:hypothetical protein